MILTLTLLIIPTVIFTVITAFKFSEFRISRFIKSPLNSPQNHQAANRRTANLRIFLRFIVLAFFIVLIGANGIAVTTAAAQTVTQIESEPRASAPTGTWLWSQRLLFRPLRANVFEPRVGSFYQLSPAKLRLDIGNSLDIVTLTETPETALRLGADFFTYTRLRSEANFRFPVETTDFFFGANASFRTNLSSELALTSRLRVAHISAHLVDGIPTFRETFVYSREFVDLVAALEWSGVRGYVGANVIFHTIPERFGALTPQVGADVMDYSLFERLTGSSIVALCVGYDLKFPTVNGATSAVHAAQAGIRVGTKNAAGVFLGAYWYDGNSLHGMFYNERDSYLGVGFQIDF